MVEDIKAIKDRILSHIDREAEDLDRVNVNELGELVDMVKDLAEAEKYCWEASYYKATSEAMGGYRTESGRVVHASQGGYAASDEKNLMKMLEEEYHHLSPNERTAMRNKVLATLGMK